jgi:hypothetical protein
VLNVKFVGCCEIELLGIVRLSWCDLKSWAEPLVLFVDGELVLNFMYICICVGLKLGIEFGIGKV